MDVKSVTPLVCSVSGFVVTYIKEGSCGLEANQAGDSTYHAATTVSRSTKRIYSVGEVGPGGGVIFYVDLNIGFRCGENFNDTSGATGGLCNYHEVAPDNWSGSVNDPIIPWAIGANATPGLDIPGLVNNTMKWGSIVTDERGRGLQNSNYIVQQNGQCFVVAGCTYAAGAARAYAGGGKSDWYLPSITELRTLYIRKASGALGKLVFNDSYYFSSSEVNAGKVYWIWLPNGGGDMGQKNEVQVGRSRPIRSF